MKISVTSLNPADREGWLKKQGEHYRTWKKRWFVLKGRQLVYFETQKDNEPKGIVDLEPSTIVRDERANDKKSRMMFSVSTARRIFYIYAKTDVDMKTWMDAIKSNVEKLAQSPASVPLSLTPSPSYTGNGTKAAAGFVPTAGADASPRARLATAKNCIPFLADETSKVLEFWQIWTESIPLTSDLLPGMALEFQVAAAADLQKLTWRNAGPQNICIQKMVDFFWNVGAPESEIDRLNSVGGVINPIKIGSWIDMSGYCQELHSVSRR